MRPSPSHLTTASSSLARSTIPNSPVGTPKLHKPSTRSRGVNAGPVAEGSARGGVLERSESGVAPRCDRGGWGVLRSVGVALFVIWVIVDFLSKWGGQCFLDSDYLLDRYRIGFKGTDRLV